MRRGIIIFMACLGIGFLQNCIEPVEIEINEQTSFLVVDGLISPGKGPFGVKLSRSGPLDAIEFTPEEEAEVRIEEENGESEVLEELLDGHYASSGNGIEGEIGKKYRLTILTKDGNNYASDWVEMKATPEIDSVNFRYEEKLTETGDLKGVQIYVNTRDPNNQTRFYRWDWVETWMYRAPFSSPYEYLGNDDIQLIPAKDICWKSESSNNIHIATSTNNATDVITEHPLLYVSTKTERLRMRYSILVRQYALTENEYLFWRSLKEANEEGGNLFDKQPQSTVGNIRNINNPSEPVLGYFSASEVSEERIFIDRSDMPEGLLIGLSFFRTCLELLDTIPKSSTSDEEVFEAISEGKVFYDFDRVIQITGYILTTQECNDCRLQDGRLEKPEFWID